MNCAKEPLANKSFVIETVIVEVISDALIKFVTSSSVTEIQTALKDTNAKIKCVYHPVMIPKIVPKITFVTTPIASLSFVNVTQIAMLAQGRVNVKKIDAFFLVLFVDVKMRGRPLANDHPEGSSSKKRNWGSQ